ncbi:MAG: hypothetical protein Q8R74_13345 [Methylophilus sp.]|nr:hypothetical protein [Methylophilus sp.]
MSISRAVCIFIGLFIISLSTITHAKQIVSIEKVIYSEQEFIDAFDGKSRSEVQRKLGNPDKKAMATRPESADQYTEKAGDTRLKKDAVEMWYYSRIVKFNDKKTYKLIELTFANDKCVNFSFAF